jgi:hypothetical protein
MDGDEGNLGLQGLQKEILERLDQLLNKQLNEVALAVASGSHFRCVLTDDAVIEGMNDWLEADKKYARLASGEATKDDNAASISDLHDLNPDRWKKWEEELEELAAQRVELARQSLGAGWRTLQQIRDGVEAYARAPFDDSVGWDT